MSRASHYRAQADFARRLAEPSSRIWSANYAPFQKNWTISASGRYVAESTKRSPNPGRFGGFAATDMAAAAELEPSLAPLR